MMFKNLLDNLNYPLAAPSANISNKLSSVMASDVKEEFGTKDKIYLRWWQVSNRIRVNNN